MEMVYMYAAITACRVRASTAFKWVSLKKQAVCWDPGLGILMQM